MYRPNVSMIIFRKTDGKFLIVHKPRKHHAWQFPQGGVDPGEENEQAALRELDEELGTKKFSILGKSQHLLFYDFPAGELREGKYRGHKQSYFMVEYKGEDNEITLHPDELDDHRWIYQNELADYIESQEYLKKINQVIYEFHRDKPLSGL